MKTSKLKIIPLAMSLALGLGVVGKAHAEAYALSYDNVYNGLIIATVNGVVPALGNPFLNFGLPQNTSGSSATLNGVGVSFSDTGSGLRDAPISVAPGSSSAPANNAFTPLGQSATANYSYGDAQVSKVQEINGTIHATNIAESNVTHGTADAAGNNASGTLLRLTINAGADCAAAGNHCQVAIQFNADPYIKVFLDSLGLQARSRLRAVATLTDPTGTEVFRWSPDGNLGSGITGGTEISDPFSLNTQRLLTTAGTLVYDPAGTLFGAGEPATGGFFRAITADLTTGGDWQLDLGVEELVNVARAVPEPASMALLGIGLAGLGFVTRRNKQA